MGVRSDSPLWRVALLLFLAPLVAQGREILREPSPARLDSSSWASCQQTVCSRVRDEAEGLARLKLLRGYVTETVRLLDSLMDSMDSELVEIATEMKDFVGPRCEAAHQLLGQVAEAMPQRHAELSAGIMEESTAQRVVAGQTSGREGLDSDIEQSHDNDIEQGHVGDSQLGWARPDPDSGDYSPDTGRELSSGQHSSFASRKGIGEGGSASSSSSSLGWGIENTANSVYSEEDPQDARNGQDGWRTGPGSGGHYQGAGWQQNLGSKGRGRQLDQGSGGGSHSQRHNSAEETYQTSSSNQYNSAVSHTANSGSRVVSGGSSSNWRPVQTGPNCRGLRGSPFAVPGIDDWCLQNCARGYCPTTHCTCE